MTEGEFIKRLREIPFAEEKYIEVGSGEAFIKRTLARYNPIQKTECIDLLGSDPILNLVNTYDLSATDIGMVCFEYAISENEDYIVFAKFESEPVGISKIRKEIVMLSDETGLEGLSCAMNSEKFLDSLIVAGEFLESLIINRAADSQEIICAMAHNCADLSGGQKYLDFYKLMLGCWT
jgi:hypothetical protein